MRKIKFIEQEDGPPIKILTCDCGAEHDLSYISNDFTCRQFVSDEGHRQGKGCNRDYNAFGQELKPRDQWEEAYDDE